GKHVVLLHAGSGRDGESAARHRGTQRIERLEERRHVLEGGKERNVHARRMGIRRSEKIGLVARIQDGLARGEDRKREAVGSAARDRVEDARGSEKDTRCSAHDPKPKGGNSTRLSERREKRERRER